MRRLLAAVSIVLIVGCSSPFASNPQASRTQCETLWHVYKLEIDAAGTAFRVEDYEKASYHQLRANNLQNTMLHRGCCRYDSSCLAG